MNQDLERVAMALTMLAAVAGLVTVMVFGPFAKPL